MASKLCSVSDCTGIHYARKLCTKHYRQWRKSVVNPALPCYKSMIERCYNPNAVSFYLYGGQGITVCDRWLESFDNFIADMGDRPGPKYSIDRINPYGNYEPGNCRWATVAEQAKNKRPRGSLLWARSNNR